MTNQHSSSTSFLARMPPIPNLKGNILESQSPQKKKKKPKNLRKGNLTKLRIQQNKQAKHKKKMNITSIYSLSIIKNNNNFFSSIDCKSTLL